MKWDWWDVGGCWPRKVEYGARCVHLSHFLRYSESILIRVDRGTMLNRRISSRSIDWACFGAQKHPATTVKTPDLGTPDTILDLPLVTYNHHFLQGYFGVFNNVPQTFRTWKFHAQGISMRAAHWRCLCASKRSRSSSKHLRSVKFGPQKSPFFWNKSDF